MNSTQSPTPSIRAMTIADYDGLIGLLKQTEGVTFRDADSKESTDRYLQRNPGLSFLAYEGEKPVGCVMSGHDGRRGYLQHLVVLAAYRNRGIASQLIECCLAELESLGIVKTHIDVLTTNEAGQRFWSIKGWKQRTDILRYSLVRSGTQNA